MCLYSQCNAKHSRFKSDIMPFQELSESFNYGLFLPPSNGKAGKFLDEERRLSEYPFQGPLGFLEVRPTIIMISQLNFQDSRSCSLFSPTDATALTCPFDFLATSSRRVFMTRSECPRMPNSSRFFPVRKISRFHFGLTAATFLPSRSQLT